MTFLLLEFERLAPFMVWGAVTLALSMAAAVVAGRAAFGIQQARSRLVTRRYQPLVQRAVAGDETARRELSASPARLRLAIAWLLIAPLIDDRDPERIAGTRAVAKAMSVLQLADRYLRSWWWWRRALALRALGLIQARDHTAQLIAALDDRHPDVRAAALDALTDLRDPATVPLSSCGCTTHPCIVAGAARRSRRSEPGASRSCWSCRRPIRHTGSITPTRSPPVAPPYRGPSCAVGLSIPASRSAAAFEALAYVGLDDDAARVAVEGLESDDPPVRAMAAYALRGWQGPGETAARLASHLDDTWSVAVRAARTLQSMGHAGGVELQLRASRPNLAGVLARQMLWQPDARS